MYVAWYLTEQGIRENIEGLEIYALKHPKSPAARLFYEEKKRQVTLFLNLTRGHLHEQSTSYVKRCLKRDFVNNPKSRHFGKKYLVDVIQYSSNHFFFVDSIADIVRQEENFDNILIEVVSNGQLKFKF